MQPPPAREGVAEASVKLHHAICKFSDGTDAITHVTGLAGISSTTSSFSPSCIQASKHLVMEQPQLWPPGTIQSASLTLQTPTNWECFKTMDQILTGWGEDSVQCGLNLIGMHHMLTSVAMRHPLISSTRDVITVMYADM